MKKFSYVLLSLFSAVMLTASCGKDGAIGAKGDTGAQGTAGVVGPAGPAGANGQNGSVIYSGAAVPDAGTGATGDFYLNNTTGLLYGPKTAAGWGAGFSLKGATGNTGANGANGTNGTDGTNGAAGSQILTGTVIPAADLGNTGDYYLNKSTYLLYGPKADGGWGVAVSLQGPAGPAGTANVKYSGWNYAVRFVDSTFDNSSIKAGHLPAPALDAEFMNSGSAFVYVTYGGGVLPLPYVSNAGGKPNTIAFFPKSKEFVVYRFTHDNSNSVALSTLLQYRYVLIPGGVKIAKANGINLNNYEEVKRFFHIAD